MGKILKGSAGFAVLMCLLTFQSPTYSDDLLFKETSGQKVEYSASWTIVTNGRLIIYSTNTMNEIHIVTCGQDYNTLSWNYKDNENNTDVATKRDGNLIITSGQQKNIPVCITNKIDGSPWFESIGDSLSPFSISKTSSIEFWFIRFSNFESYKMAAYKGKIENIKVNGNSVEAQKVTVTLTGLLSIFWKADYWFRIPDGQYIRFEGNREGADTVEELMSINR